MGDAPPVKYPRSVEARRRLHELLAQETRHHIIQTILGHPDCLPSLAELAYYTQKSEAAILDQLETLEEHDVVATYTHEEGQNRRDVPGTFYGLTERGTHLLDEFGYFRGVPALRAIHLNTVKPDRIGRHEAAPRPDLPSAVAEILDFDEELGDGPEKTTEPLAEATAEEEGAFDDLFE